MKYTRRLAALFLSLMLVFASGCKYLPSFDNSGDSGSSASSVPAPADSSEITSSEESSAELPKSPEPYTLPLTRQRLTLRVFLPIEADRAASLAENELLSSFTQKSRVFLDIVCAEEGTPAEKLASLFASNTVPDIIYGIGILEQSPDQLVSSSRILALNEYIDQWGYNLYQAFQDDPELYRQVLTYEKNIAVYPFARVDALARYDKDFFFREDWLHSLGLSVPTTPEGWQTVLESFKNSDPNENDYPDEIPFVDTLGQGGVFRLASVFGFNGSFETGWATTVLNGKVTFAAFAPGFERYITALSQWYENGLIQEDFDEKNFDALSGRFSNNAAGVFFGTLSDAESILRSYNYESGDSGFELVPAPAAVASDGSSTDFLSSEAYLGDGAAVSYTTDHVKEAVLFLDYLFGPEGRLLLSFGQEGTTFRYNGAGEPVFTELITDGEGYSYAEALDRYTLIDSGLRLASDALYLDVRHSGTTKNRIYSALSPASQGSRISDYLPLSDVERTRLTLLMKDIESVYTGTVLRFIKGEEPVSPTSLRTKLTSMGIDEAVRILQTAYDRMHP